MKDFETWWAELPSAMKKSKLLAAKHWRRLKARWTDDRPMVDVLVEAIRKQKRADHFGDYPPHGSTWLSNGRWMDEVDGRASYNAALPAERNRPLTDDEKAALRQRRAQLRLIQ